MIQVRVLSLACRLILEVTFLGHLFTVTTGDVMRGIMLVSRAYMPCSVISKSHAGIAAEALAATRFYKCRVYVPKVIFI